jgi:hypothetical protein
VKLAPAEEELLAAAKCALEWFEAWDEYPPNDCAPDGKYRVMKKLSRAVRRAHEEA